MKKLCCRPRDICSVSPAFCRPLYRFFVCPVSPSSLWRQLAAFQISNLLADKAPMEKLGIHTDRYLYSRFKHPDMTAKPLSTMRDKNERIPFHISAVHLGDPLVSLPRVRSINGVRAAFRHLNPGYVHRSNFSLCHSERAVETLRFKQCPTSISKTTGISKFLLPHPNLSSFVMTCTYLMFLYQVPAQLILPYIVCRYP